MKLVKRENLIQGNIDKVGSVGEDRHLGLHEVEVDAGDGGGEVGDDEGVGAWREHLVVEELSVGETGHHVILPAHDLPVNQHLIRVLIRADTNDHRPLEPLIPSSHLQITIILPHETGLNIDHPEMGLFGMVDYLDLGVCVEYADSSGVVFGQG